MSNKKVTLIDFKDYFDFLNRGRLNDGTYAITLMENELLAVSEIKNSLRNGLHKDFIQINGEFEVCKLSFFKNNLQEGECIKFNF